MVKINIVGDFCVPNLAGLHFDKGLADFLREGDVNAVNLESPIVSKDAKQILKSGPSLRQDEKACEFLKNQGFNLFSLANNHFMDYGRDAALDTINRLNDSVTLGCGSWNDAYQYKVIEVDHIKIAFLAITQYEFGVLNERSYGDDFGTAWLLHPSIDEWIIKAKKNSDILILLPHAGLEHFDYPLPELRTLYRHYVSMGADAIVANHPHVPQPFENYCKVPIFYSLGNFVFDALSPQNQWWYRGLLVHLRIDLDKHLDFSIKPICFDKEHREVKFDSDISFGHHIEKINSIFKDEKQYIDAVNSHSLSLEYLYDYQFECGGYFRPNIKKYLKEVVIRLKEKFLGKKLNQFNSAAFINNLRCEPHRWVLSRIYELKNNIQ